MGMDSSLLSGAGVLTGAQGPPSAQQIGAFAQVSVAGIATGATQLSTFNASASGGIQNRTIAGVGTVGDYFQLIDGSSLTPDNLTVVTAAGRPGAQWLRMGIQNVAWQQRTGWVLDPQNVAANDENDGSSAGAPLKTFQELARRVFNAVYSGAVTYTLNSDCLSTDQADFSSLRFTGGGNITVSGTPGGAIYTGTVTSFAAQSLTGAADDNELVDNSIPVSFTASGLLGAGLLFKRTNGPAAYWYGMKDLGAKTLRTSVPSTVSGGTPSTISPGDTYTVSPLPKVFGLRWPLPTFTAPGIVYLQVNESAPADLRELREYCYELSWISTAKSWSGGSFFNCCFNSTGTGYTFYGWNAGATGQISGGCFLGTGATLANQNFGVWSLKSVSFEGCVWLTSSGGTGFCTGRISFYDCTQPCVQSQYWSAFYIYAASGGTTGYGIGGLNNTSQLIAVQKWSKCAYESAAPIVAGSTSAGNQLSVGGNLHTIAQLPLVPDLGDQGIFQTNVAASAQFAQQPTTVASGAVTVSLTNAPAGSPATPARWARIPDGAGGFYTFPSTT